MTIRKWYGRRAGTQGSVVRLASVVAVGATLFCARPGRAESSAPASAERVRDGAASTAAPAEDKARAETLFNAGVALVESGSYELGCQKLEASLTLYDALGTSFHLASCWQALGRTASAYELFEKVALRSFKAGQLDRAAVARERMLAVAPTLSRVRVDVDEKTRAQSPEVKMNDEPIAPADWGKSLPVNPGHYVVAVSAEEKRSWSKTFEVKDPGTTYALAIPSLEDAHQTPSAAPARMAPPAQRKREDARSSGPGRRIAAYTLGTAGVVGVAAGVWFGVRYRTSNGDAQDLCPSGVGCTQYEIIEHARLVDEARTARTWAFVGASVGVAALASASYLFLSGHGGEKARSASRSLHFSAEPIVGERGTWGAALRGAF